MAKHYTQPERMANSLKIVDEAMKLRDRLDRFYDKLEKVDRAKVDRDTIAEWQDVFNELAGVASHIQEWMVENAGLTYGAGGSVRVHRDGE